jgi:hypothetical protein
LVYYAVKEVKFKVLAVDIGVQCYREWITIVGNNEGNDIAQLGKEQSYLASLKVLFSNA